MAETRCWFANWARIERWVQARPEFTSEVLDWREQFERDPYAESLVPFPFDTGHGDNAWEYCIPGVPIMIVVVISKIEDPKGYRTWILHPRKPDEVAPQDDMV